MASQLGMCLPLDQPLSLAVSCYCGVSCEPRAISTNVSPFALQVSNVEVYYKAISFYLSAHPSLLVDMLKVRAQLLQVPCGCRCFRHLHL